MDRTNLAGLLKQIDPAGRQAGRRAQIGARKLATQIHTSRSHLSAGSTSGSLSETGHLFGHLACEFRSEKPARDGWIDGWMALSCSFSPISFCAIQFSSYRKSAPLSLFLLDSSTTSQTYLE